MWDFNIGDIVARISYGYDIYFKIVDIMDKDNGVKIYLLKGLTYRLEADAKGSDLKKQSPEDVEKYIDNIYQTFVKIKKVSFKNIHSLSIYNSENISAIIKAGRILHIDGDKGYMNICLKFYKELELEAIGAAIPEKDQPNAIRGLLKKNHPDILVITGHDGILKKNDHLNSLDNYKTSRYFVESVKEARRYEPSLDKLVIFAGSCQSYYEAILDAGANFASSPGRIPIHCLDPVFISEKIAYTNIKQVVSAEEVISSTISGIKGIGGLATKGKCRNIGS